MDIVDEIQASGEFLSCLRGPKKDACVAQRLTGIEAKIAAAGAAFNVQVAAKCMQALCKWNLSDAQTEQMQSRCMEAISVGDAANASADKGSSSKARTAMQNYEDIPEYFTEDMWQTLMSNEMSHAVKSDMILQHCRRLGCKCPSESTIQVLTALLLACSFGEERAALLESSVKFEAYGALKAAYKRNHAGLVLLIGPAKLPCKHQDFKDSHGTIYAAVFGVFSFIQGIAWNALLAKP